MGGSKVGNENKAIRKGCFFIISVILIGAYVYKRKENGLSNIKVNNTIFTHSVQTQKTNSYPTLVYTCIGEAAFSKFQRYIWYSLTQARMINPNIPIVVILSRKAFDKSVHAKLTALKITSFFHDDLLEINSLLRQFRKVFFLSGAMFPDGNQKFVQFAVERLLSVYAYMNYTGVSNVLHIENDNMLYVDVYKLSKRMNVCGVKLAFPRATVNQAVTSIIYVQTSKAIEHFVEWCLNIFRLGPEKAVQYLNTTWINDMTLGARYLQLNTLSRATGVLELPTTFDSRNESCCLCYLSNDNTEPIIFDSCVLGQYFGGTFDQPNTQYWERGRLIDPRGAMLEWRENGNTNFKHPFIRNLSIVNLHVHSKQLEQFYSDGSKSLMNRRSPLPTSDWTGTSTASTVQLVFTK